MHISNLHNAAELAGALSLGTTAVDATSRKPASAVGNAADALDTRTDAIHLSQESREHAAKLALAAKHDAERKTASPLARDEAPAIAQPSSDQGATTASQAQHASSPPSVTQQDLNDLLTAYGSVTGDARFDARFDFNNDGRIDFNDLNTALSSFNANPPQPVAQTFTLNDVTSLLASYGRSAGQPGFDARFDTNNDGRVDFTDLNHVLSNLNSPVTSGQQQQLQGLIEGYGAGIGDPLYNAAFDFDNDGRISFADLNELLSRIAGEPR